MIPVLTAAQAAAWDETARAKHGIPGRVLMETAGRAVAQVVADEFVAGLRQGVLLVAGPGNNGGDGWVAARALRAVGVRVLAIESDGQRSADCEANRALALASGVESLAAEAQWPAVGVVLDALLGTGATGAPRGDLARLAARVTAFGAPVAAVDGPTGLDLTTGQAHDPIRARVTITFGGVRRGHLLAREWCGRIVVVDIGFPEPDPALPALVTDRWARASLPPFRNDMHKGDRGKVLVVGGEEGMSGAAIHAASAALAAGAGLVKLAASDSTLRAANETLPDVLTVRSLLGPRLEPDLTAAIEWADAIIIGPGLGRSKERTSLVQAVRSTKKPAVIDADALHSGVEAWRAPNLAYPSRVLTPHAGEFVAAFPGARRLLDEDRFAAAEHASGEADCTILLKGVPSVVATGHAPRPDALPPGVDGVMHPLRQRDRATLVVASGTPALATGGSGDVLAGFIGAFLARGLAPHVAAALGAHALGRAAEVAAALNSARAVRPADVLAAVPALWKRWAEEPRARPPVLAELDPPILA